MSERGFAFFWIILLFSFSSGPVDAQVEVVAENEGTPEILGRVALIGDGLPIPGADIILTDSLGTLVAVALTDQTGFFRLTPPGPGFFSLEAKSIGCAPSSGLLHFGGRSTLVVKVGMSVEPIELEGIDAEVRHRPRHVEMTFDGFEDRKARGEGFFIDKSDIEEQKPSKITDLLQRVPGTQVLYGGGKPIGVTFTRNAGLTSRTCLPVIFLNGVRYSVGGTSGSGKIPEGSKPDTKSMRNELPGMSPVHGLGSLNDVTPPEWIQGIEIYRNIAVMPPQFRGLGATCGVISIWTHRE